MAIEMERRFLVKDLSVVASLEGQPIVQAYLNKERGELSTRVRIAGSSAWLTLKSCRTGLVREEFEYAIPVDDARALIGRYCGDRILQKRRYLVLHSGYYFEVDVFEGALAGLAIAELELANPFELSAVLLPPWLGREVTLDHRYGNRALAQFGLPVDIPACTIQAQPSPLEVPWSRDLGEVFT